MGFRGQETGPRVSKQSSEVRNGIFHERKPGLKDIKARALLTTVSTGWRHKNTRPGSPEEPPNPAHLWADGPQLLSAPARPCAGEPQARLRGWLRLGTPSVTSLQQLLHLHCISQMYLQRLQNIRKTNIKTLKVHKV